MYNQKSSDNASPTTNDINSNTSSSVQQNSTSTGQIFTSTDSPNYQEYPEQVIEPSSQVDSHPGVKVKEYVEVEPDVIGFSKVTDSDDSSPLLIDSEIAPKFMKERSVPASQISRMFGFGGLALRMAGSAAADNVSRLITGGSSGASLSEENAERLAEALCRMRGAALKLGQMMSLQDDSVLPPALKKALDRVRRNADYMPKRQLEHQLATHLGETWRNKFLDFEEIPIAAASIGQVHRARLLDGSDVVLKIQYPGVAESIDSDLNNLKRIVSLTNLLPPGLFIDQLIKVAREELTEECDYRLEAESQIRYRDLVLADPVLKKCANVPKIYPELCTDRILTSSFVHGVPVDRAVHLPQSIRNAVARTILYKTIRELFSWRFMQTDPNFANFLYDNNAKVLNLIDFGAARAYPKTFVDGYMELVWSASNNDRQTLLEVSKQLGFLTGDESQEMLNAHAEAGMVVGEPFVNDGPFDFAKSNMTQRIGQYGNTFVKYRLTPPPTEAYSLHRKLAGAFLLCIKLGAIIPCRDILVDAYKSYKFDKGR